MSGDGFSYKVHTLRHISYFNFELDNMIRSDGMIACLLMRGGF